MESVVDAGSSDATLKNAKDVIQDDLSKINHELLKEFAVLGGNRLLITGGAGFLGYYLVQSVLHCNKSRHDRSPILVTVLDNFLRGIPKWLLKLNAQHSSIRFIEHDITQPLPDEMGDFDFIIHAASIASPTFYRRHPIKTMDANVLGLRNLLDYAVRRKKKGHSVKSFLFFSSSEVYGDPDPEHIPTPETYRGCVSFTGPRACYDESKRFGETLCVNYHAVHDLPIKVVRPFNNYGPGLKLSDRRVLPDFARNVLAEQDIAMFSDGSPTRTFCYVADAVVGYYQALHSGTDGEAYNIGTQSPEISIRELAHLTADVAQEIFDYTGGVVCRTSSDPDYLQDNPSRRCPSIKKAREELNYRPAIGLRDGIRRSLLWYRDHQEGKDV